MNVRSIGLLSMVGLTIGLGGVNVIGQMGGDTAEKHMAAAKQVAGQDYAWMYNTLCNDALNNYMKSPALATPPAAPATPNAPPDRSVWQAEPVKVFDNLYRVGSKEHSGWALTTSDGIILMDAIYDYNVKDQVVEGLKKLGLNPASIKYSIIGHGHGDHVGGAKTLQELYNTKIIMGAADWDLLDRTNPSYKPKREPGAVDGQKITLGDTTVTVYVTPGHTQGTLSSIFTVKDAGKPHVVAYWGGTMFNWAGGSPIYISPATPAKYWFDNYAASADRFKDIAAKAGADVILSNHTAFDMSKIKEPLLPLRKPGDLFHPFVVGKDSVQRYFTTVGECAKAGSLLTAVKK